MTPEPLFDCVILLRQLSLSLILLAFLSRQLATVATLCESFEGAKRSTKSMRCDSLHQFCRANRYGEGVRGNNSYASLSSFKCRYYRKLQITY